MTFRAAGDTKPTKLQEYLSTVYAANEKLEFAERVQRPSSASPPQLQSKRSFGLTHIASAAASARKVPTDRISEHSSSEAGRDQTDGDTIIGSRSILDTFRQDNEMRRSMRMQFGNGRISLDPSSAGGPVALIHSGRGTTIDRVPHDTSGWTSTALAHSHTPTSLAAPKSTCGMIEQNSALANSLHVANQYAVAMHATILGERQQVIIVSERYERSALEEERLFQLRLWSQHLSLMLRLKAKKAILRPSQVFLESLREKDALEIKALRSQVNQLAAELAKRHTAPPAVVDPSTNSDTDRAEWNEMYKNMQDCIQQQREAIIERDRQILALSAAQTPPRHLQGQREIRSSGLRFNPVQRDALSPPNS